MGYSYLEGKRKMSEAYKCDKCGKYIDKDASRSFRRVINEEYDFNSLFKIGGNSKSIHLCKTCMIYFMKTHIDILKDEENV